LARTQPSQKIAANKKYWKELGKYARETIAGQNKTTGREKEKVGMEENSGFKQLEIVSRDMRGICLTKASKKDGAKAANGTKSVFTSLSHPEMVECMVGSNQGKGR